MIAETVGVIAARPVLQLASVTLIAASCGVLSTSRCENNAWGQRRAASVGLIAACLLLGTERLALIAAAAQLCAAGPCLHSAMVV